jgi:hypothetical protein
MYKKFGVYVLNNGLGYTDIAKLVACGLEDLGLDVEVGGKYDFIRSKADHRVIFCFKPVETFNQWYPSDDWRHHLKESDIYFNTEPLVGRNLQTLKTMEVLWERKCWDYSLLNQPVLSGLGVHPPFVLRLGYSERFAKYLAPEGQAHVRDESVLFVGSRSSRRQTFLQAMGFAGIAVEAYDETRRISGKELHLALQRAKALVNVKFSADYSLETFRITPALTLGCPVISEGSGDPMEKEYSDYVTFAPLADLPRVIAEADMSSLSQRAAAFKDKPMSEYLRVALEQVGLLS